MAEDDRALGWSGPRHARPAAGGNRSLTRYLLDTNIISDIVRHPDGRVVEAMALASVDEILTSVIVAAELKVWVRKSGSERLRRLVKTTLLSVPPVPLGVEVADTYAEIRSHLESVGRPIGGNDLLIAAHALCVGAVMVTDNVREFERVPGLDVRNWLRGASASA